MGEIDEVPRHYTDEYECGCTAETDAWYAALPAGPWIVSDLELFYADTDRPPLRETTVFTWCDTHRLQRWKERGPEEPDEIKTTAERMAAISKITNRPKDVCDYCWERRYILEPGDGHEDCRALMGR